MSGEKIREVLRLPLHHPEHPKARNCFEFFKILRIFPGTYNLACSESTPYVYSDFLTTTTRFQLPSIKLDHLSSTVRITNKHIPNTRAEYPARPPRSRDIKSEPKDFRECFRWNTAGRSLAKNQRFSRVRRYASIFFRWGEFGFRLRYVLNCLTASSCSPI